MNSSIETTSVSGKLRQIIREHPLFFFFVLAYAISWLIWLPPLASAQGFLDRPVSPYLHLVGELGPLFAALIVTGITTGRTGILELAKRMFRWRVNLVWHLIAWFSPVVLFIIAAIIARIVWGTWPALSRFGQTAEYPQLALLVYWAAALFFYGWGEETGWRGFALPKLQKNHNALTSTFLLSIFWALWHLPVFWFVDGFMKMGIGGAIGWYFSILLGAVLFTWLYNSTTGSILIVAVFHATMNIVFDSPFSGDFATVLGMLMTVWGIAMLFFYRPTWQSGRLKPVLE
jgi:membrane protease YdiL (CAAX protease family)